MANVGSASLRIVPKFDGLSASVNKALSQVDASGSGRALGGSLASGVEQGVGGLATSGALVGVFAALTSKAMDSISSHVGSAVQRLDTLKNYPMVMQALGVSSDEAEASIQTMSDRLQGLPTTLDAMASVTQGIYAATKDYGVSLTTATAAGLAMNDMLLSGGASTQVVNSAMEQFRQMLAKGKPDMQDWRSMLSAAPGQMDQLAKSMIGPTASANDLYYALGGGKDSDAHLEGLEHASISMGELLDAVVRLDSEGGAGMASFSSQATEATGGIGTAAANLGNAVTRGIADVMDAIGRENIVGVINDVKAGVRETFSTVTRYAGPAAESLNRVWSAVKPLAPAVVAVSAAVAGFGAARTGFALLADGAKLASGAATAASNVFLTLGAHASGPLAEGCLSAAVGAEGLAATLTGPLGIALAAAGVGAALMVGHFMDVQRQMEAADAATKAFRAATEETSALTGYSEVVSGIGQAAEDTTDYITNLTSSFQAHADAMARNASEAEGTIATWTTVQQIFDELIGEEGLIAEEQGRLNWALQQYNEATGEAVTASDVLAGEYVNQQGETVRLADSVRDLTQARIDEARTSAITANLTEAYQAQEEAARALAQAQVAYNEAYAEGVAELGEGASAAELNVYAINQMSEAERNAYYDALSYYGQANQAVQSYEAELGNLGVVMSSTSDEYTRFVSGNALMSAALVNAGADAGGFAAALRELGIDTQALGTVTSQEATVLAQAYKDSEGSVDAFADALAEMGDVGSGAFSTIDRAAGLSATNVYNLKSTMGSWDGVHEALGSLGIDMDGLCAALDGAGITAGAMATLTSDEFAAMAEACGYDLEALIASCAELDGVQIGDKTFYVDDDGTIRDEQGEIYSLNDTDAVDHFFEVSDRRTTEQCRAALLMLGRQDVADKYFDVRATDYATSELNRIDSIRLKDKTFTVTANGAQVGYSATGSVSDAAYIPRHADGYIATGPTLTNNGWVGEDGAEAVLNWATGGAVVPLTNTRYMRPIAEAIAKEMDATPGGADAELVIAWLARNLGPIINGSVPTTSRRDQARDVRRLVYA